MVHGYDNHLLRKIHNLLGRSSGQQIPVALGYDPWLFKRPPNALTHLTEGLAGLGSGGVTG